MSELVAWKSKEKPGETTKPPQRWLTVGLGQINGNGVCKIDTCLFCLEEDLAREALGLTAELPEKPVRVRLTLEVLG